ncbi:hypothetical protein ACSSS7_003792 [Eimeria intestinalis]
MMPSAAVRTAAATSAVSGVNIFLNLTLLPTNPTEQTTERGAATSPLPCPCRPSCNSCKDADVVSLMLTLQLPLLLILPALQLEEGCGPYTRAMTLVHPSETTARPSQFVKHPEPPPAATAAAAADSDAAAAALAAVAAASGTEVRHLNCRASCTNRPSARKPQGETASALYIASGVPTAFLNKSSALQ